MKGDPNEDRMVECAQLLRRFNHTCVQYALFTALFGLLSMCGGILCFLTDHSLLKSAGVPLVLAGMFVLWCAFQLSQRARQALGSLPVHEIPNESFFKAYLVGLDRFSWTVRQTRDVTAIGLALALVGVVVSCLVERLEFALGGWLAIASIVGIICAAETTYTFLLELHGHEIQRRL